jgi:hypothetical protein
MAKEIQLTKGLVALVDEEDHKMLMGLGVRWCVNDGYAFNAKLGRMHRYLLSAPEGVMVDHRNGNKLDNQRENLRLCSNSQNQANRRVAVGKSKFKGVVWQKRKSGTGFWKAQITVNKQVIYLGAFPTDLDAAKAYNQAALAHFGEFAHLNDLTLSASDVVSSERRQINRANPTGFKGVSYSKERNKWVAQLRYKGVWHLLKRFATAEDAAKAYDEVVRRVFGKDAVTNFKE